MNSNEHILFREEQQFRQNWLWIILIASSITTVVILFVTLSAEKKPINEMLLSGSLVLLVTLINLAAFYFAQFETIVTTQGINYRWWPFFKKFSTIKWNDINEAAVRKYPYLKIGYHQRKGFGKVHNVEGGKGIQFVLKNGKKIFIGSQKIPGFQYSIEKSINKTVEMLQ